MSRRCLAALGTRDSRRSGMDWSEADVRRNRDYFLSKLHAIKQRTDVVKAIEQGRFDSPKPAMMQRICAKNS